MLLLSVAIGGRVIHSVGTLHLCNLAVGFHVVVRLLHMHLVVFSTMHMPSDHVLVKLDFKNAFNSLSRACMIRAVQQFSPDIHSFVYSAYAYAFSFYGDHTL